VGRSADQPVRAPLSRDGVVVAALAIADRDGIGALTMRALATELGVKPMSVYHYVRDKDEILDALVDAVFAEVEPIAPERPWRDALAGRTRSMRAVLRRHPWAIGLMESRVNAGPASLAHHDAVLGVMRRAGFTVEAAAQSYALLDSYAYGFALQEVSLPFDGPDSVADVAADFELLLADGSYPHLAEMLTTYVMRPGYDFGDNFEVGLGVVLDGVAALRRRGRATA
jgi:AcrR family transcriptional regulator